MNTAPRLESKRPGGRPRRDVDLSRVRELLDQGTSLRQAARQLGLGCGTIHRAARSLKSQSDVIQNPIAEALPQPPVFGKPKKTWSARSSASPAGCATSTASALSVTRPQGNSRSAWSPSSAAICRPWQGALLRNQSRMPSSSARRARPGNRSAPKSFPTIPIWTRFAVARPNPTSALPSAPAATHAGNEGSGSDTC